MARCARILSIDGGGIRGILPGQLLTRLESHLQRASGDSNARIADYFDLVAGTSTGGILASLLTCPAPAGGATPRPRYTAAQAVDLYLERGDEIFSVSAWQKLRSAGGLTDEKYSADELEEALGDYFGDLRLSELITPTLITAYDVRRRAPFFFRQHRAATDDGHDFLVSDLCRATSAAPTYFELPRIRSRSGIRYPLIDGGVFANNPAMCAYAEARGLGFEGTPALNRPGAARMRILSLGTGTERKPYAWDEAKDWGKAGWALPLINILMQGNADTVDYQLRQIFDTVPASASGRYVRIEPALGAASAEMDNAHPENLERLREAGMEAADLHDETIREFAAELVRNK